MVSIRTRLIVLICLLIATIDILSCLFFFVHTKRVQEAMFKKLGISLATQILGEDKILAEKKPKILGSVQIGLSTRKLNEKIRKYSRPTSGGHDGECKCRKRTPGIAIRAVVCDRSHGVWEDTGLIFWKPLGRWRP